MKHLAVYAVSLVLFLLSFHTTKAQTLSESFEYYGADNQEAEFLLGGQIVVLQARAPTREQVDPLIRMQMRYMLGLMRSRENQAAALYPKWSFTTQSVTQVSPGRWLVKYNLKTKGVFAKGVTHYTFTVPLNPRTIFRESELKCMKETAVQDSNFWYHWEPLLPGCPLIENKHYYNYTAELKPIPNTEKTYPEYEKLVDSNKEIKVTMFFGFEHYGVPNWNPAITADWGMRSFDMQKTFLKRIGFKEEVWTTEKITALYRPRDKFVPQIIEYNRGGSVANVRIRMILLDTGYGHNSTAFHHLLKDALANESVIIYSGHSGIGKNLDIPSIEKLRGIKMPMGSQYQILFLNSCVPYSYYTDLFFNKKRSASDPNGTKQLDILSYGKESYFGNEQDRVLTTAVLRYALNGYRSSYQEMIKNGSEYFFGVSGDEDNPTQ